VLGVALLAAPLGAPRAQTAGGGLQAFPDFINDVKIARAADFVGQIAGGVDRATEFEAMRQHLLTLYGDAIVSHSYRLDGQVFDCVGIDKQPAVILQKLPGIASPPPLRPAPSNDGDATQTDDGMHDALGNVETCVDGTIPMRRLTLDELGRFKTLRAFFQKDGQDATSRDAAPAAAASHKYAFEEANINNYGGYSYLNLWNPLVNTALKEVFSLSQQWYAGGSGAGLQTAETGWQNYPQKYGTANSVLFIYWTADDYTRTGCYNLDCAAFVQTSSSYNLGGSFSNYSASGRRQSEIGLGYYLYQGNWWLAVGGVWLGYYPGTLYKGGQLSNSAQIFELGGETVGTTVWPPMGSGAFAASGYGYAAYHRGIFYRNSADGTFSPNLIPEEFSPKCYTLAKPLYRGSKWQAPYFFFGGPGGGRC
jgi:hypothetical protein